MVTGDFQHQSCNYCKALLMGTSHQSTPLENSLGIWLLKALKETVEKLTGHRPLIFSSIQPFNQSAKSKIHSRSIDVLPHKR